MNDPALNDWHRLFSGALNNTLSETEKVGLASLLKTSVEARQLWFLYHDNECGLSELKQSSAASSAGPVSRKQPSAPVAWLAWRPLTAAAAGLFIGLFSATMVWGYVGRPTTATTTTLLQDSFESGPAPEVTGVPLHAGRWSGDYSEVVGEYRGVKPASGGKMLRFIRADYEGKPAGDGYIADVFRIIDLGGSDLDVARGDACISVEAKFRSLPQDGKGRIRCSVTLHALDALPEAGERHQFFLKPRDGFPQADGDTPTTGATILATATRQDVCADAGVRWQTAHNELRVPPGTRYLMVHLHEWLMDSKGPREPQPVEFAGLFIDDVRVSLTHRPPLP